MSRWKILTLPLVLLLAAGAARACSLCGANLQQSLTFRQEAAQPTARIIFIGTAEKSELKSDGKGTTDLAVNEVLRSDPFLGDRKTVTLERYLPVDRKNPQRFLVFCDVFKDRLDPFRGVPLKSAQAVEYVRKVFKFDERDRIASLLFFFDSLEAADPEVARDAFLEFAKATDQEIGQIGPRLSPEKLRTWLKEARAPERLGIYALLLGACGRDEDASYLRSLLDNERYVSAYDGIIGGYVRLRPREGWDLALSILRDGSKPVALRLAVARTLSFYHGWQPKESRDNVLRCLEAMISQGELADLAVEDMRRWQMWDRTRDVLALYGKKGYDAPLMQRAILRYALSCKDESASAFLTERRRQEPEVVKEVEDSLRFDK
jgi:hypothetical protein